MSSTDLWYFSQQGKGTEGWSDPALMTFREKSSLGRESAQNSLSAPANDAQPVLVRYEVVTLMADHLPGRDNFHSHLQACLEEFTDEDSTGGEIDCITRMIEMLESPIVQCLKISDFNTTGLCGDAEDNSKRLFKFASSNGWSTPIGASPGSYGLGKNALIGASALRCIYVVSHLHENSRGTLPAQLKFGLTRLCTHRDPNSGVRIQSLGHFGDGDHQDDEFIRPHRFAEGDLGPFHRDTAGTDIWILGFDSDENWHLDLAESLIEGFFLAVLHNRIEFQIIDKGELVRSISSDSIALDLDWLIKQSIESRRDSRSTERYIKMSSLGNVRGQILAATLLADGERVHVDEKELQTVPGKAKLSVYIDEIDPSLTNRTSIHRNPKMTICHESIGSTLLPGFNAVLEVKSGNNKNEANYHLLQMEDETHTKLSPNHVRDKKNVKPDTCKLLMKELREYVRDFLTSLRPLGDDAEDIRGLSRFLPDDIPDSSSLNRQQVPGNEEESPNSSLSDPSIPNTDPVTGQSISNPASSTTANIPALGSNSPSGGGSTADRKIQRKTQARKRPKKGGTSRSYQRGSLGIPILTPESCHLRIWSEDPTSGNYIIFIKADKKVESASLYMALPTDDGKQAQHAFLLQACDENNMSFEVDSSTNCIKGISLEKDLDMTLHIKTTLNYPVAIGFVS